MTEGRIGVFTDEKPTLDFSACVSPIKRNLFQTNSVACNNNN